MVKTLEQIMKIWISAAVSLAALAAGSFAATSAEAQVRSREGGWNRGGQPEKTQELPKCAQPLGTVAIQQPERVWWTELGLASPEALIKLMASRSGCFRVVERGQAGMAMREMERDMAQSGELRRGSNMGRGLVRAADYIIIPDIVNSDSNAGGGAVAGAIGGLVGGTAGALIGGIRTRRLEAHTLLTLVNARTTEQEFVAEGTASKRDLGFAVGGWLGGGGAGGGGYADTEIGRVITAAYVDSFVELVNHLGGPGAPAADASAAAGPSAMEVDEATTMRRTASPTAPAVRSLRPGLLVYPTGQRQGVWWEVDDETGNRGWVLSTALKGS